MKLQEKTLEIILKGGVILPLFALTLTPLWVNSKFLFPFITPKTIYFRLLVEIALFFYLLLIWRYPQYRPHIKPLGWAVAVYLLVILLSGLFGINIYRSFWGTIERGEGIITILHIGLMFLMMISVFKSRKLWLWFLEASVFTSFLVSFYALAQFLGAQWVINSGETRLSATIGNASFLAAYLLLHIFFLLLLLIWRTNLWLRIWHSLLIVFELFIIFHTETRGALLALTVTFLILGLLYVIRGRQLVLRAVMIGLVFLIITGGVLLWLNRSSDFVENNSTLNRLANISLTDITAESRLLTWQASWQAFTDRPLLGYGWENYNVAFNKYFPPKIFKDQGSQIWFDRAHNIFFDVLVTTGLLGILVYLIIYLFTLKEIYYARRQQIIKFETTLLLIGLLLAYFGQNLFVFDTLPTYLGFFTALGLIHNMTTTRLEPATPRRQRNKRFSFNFAFLIALIALFSFIVYFVNIKPAQANRLGVQGLRLAHIDKQQEALLYFKKALALNTYQNPELRQKLAEFVLSTSRSNQFSELEIFRNFELAVKEIKKNIKQAPLDVQNYMFLMTLYNNMRRFDPQVLEKVLILGKEAIRLSPTRPQIYFEMGQAALVLGRKEEGINYFKKALQLQPKAKESQWNLAVAYIVAGKKEKAQDIFQQMISQGFKYNSKENLTRLISVFQAAGDWVGLADNYERLIKLEPENADYYAQAAAAYQKVGDLEKARMFVKKAVSLDPSLKPEARQFLNNLDSQLQNKEMSQVKVKE